MARKEFPGDPRLPTAIVAYTPASSSADGGIYYMTAFASSMGALFVKAKWIGWVAVFASMLSIFNDRISASSSGGSRLSTITLALTALMMTYTPELISVYNRTKGN
ncbi:hypothetical protein BX661DRAFT_182400 [Kickxella alabastrina]|uniref:Uncharacterized protein n=2 Tax=Kickxella alabastrina TaxID=61397 RepID=A0ACC1I856_9FUNG|nr:uncharacterized protein BX661DRAFT_182400 [Kickxella alabastrina]KAI7827764.1 hypothetical protein BX661DRAFT_182400 [Kickxella alabastrina]KAJ1888384.1 hypothetical protein LPJ66_008609 [Kickxella alabastrina]KAJ1889649.1 hypothetical protein LPJ66_007921 [Kickxella alabastrina]